MVPLLLKLILNGTKNVYSDSLTVFACASEGTGNVRADRILAAIIDLGIDAFVNVDTNRSLEFISGRTVAGEGTLVRDRAHHSRQEYPVSGFIFQLGSLSIPS